MKNFLLVLLVFFGKSELQAQYLLFNSNDTFYFFKEYAYHLNLKEKDTSLLFLKLDLRTNDIQKMSSHPYNGNIDYAQFFIDKKKSQIRVNLYDGNKLKIKTEYYSYNRRVVKITDIYFLNLAGLKRKLYWNTIETRLIK